MDDKGAVHSYVRKLWQEGLVLDVGHGSGSFSFDSAEALLAVGVVPDVISSDIHQMAVMGPMHDLPTTLSKFLQLGMSLRDVIARATVRPALAMRRPDLGTLQVGSPADIALFRLVEGDVLLYDTAMKARHGSVQLVNTATYVAGSLLPAIPPRPPAQWVAMDFPPEQRPALRRAF